MPATEPDHADLLADLELVTAVAREAGTVAMRYFRQKPDVWMKAGESPVSEADIAVDDFLRGALLAARPNYGWLSEETADSDFRLKARRTFVVDPIDGTRAFINGGDCWCISVAVVEAGIPMVGVLDAPARSEVFTGSLGAGARLNGDRINVGQAGDEVLVGGPKPMLTQLPADLRRRVAATPHIPSLAYRLAMVAAGRLDATFVKPHSHDWDIAAAEVILREAGGHLLDETGRTPPFAGRDPRHGKLLAGSGPLLRELSAAMAKMRD